MGNEKIAIIGSIGCGKTVLLTVLSKRYQKRSPEGYQILPDNKEANLFCLKNWETLEGCEWPAPTPPEDTPPVYKWKLRFGRKEKDMVTSDIAGEAWQTFIENNLNELDNKSLLSSWMDIKKKWESIPASLSQLGVSNQLMTVESLLKEASSIFYILDLSQIIDKESGYEVAAWLPVSLEKYMERIGKKDVPITLVLSKADKYPYLFEGGKDVRSVLEEYIPRLPQYKGISINCRIFPESSLKEYLARDILL